MKKIEINEEYWIEFDDKEIEIRDSTYKYVDFSHDIFKKIMGIYNKQIDPDKKNGKIVFDLEEFIEFGYHCGCDTNKKSGEVYDETGVIIKGEVID